MEFPEDGAPPRRKSPEATSSRHLRAVLTAVDAAALPRKEVIQPQLPLRLPCYDFVPITSPTLGSCAPEGFAHRLQVLPAFMT